MRSSSSIVPLDRLDRDIYLVLEDFGARAGCDSRETDEQDTDLETVLRHLLSGQYTYPVRIVAFNAIEGWSRDATSTSPPPSLKGLPIPTLRFLPGCTPSSRRTGQGALGAAAGIEASRRCVSRSQSAARTRERMDDYYFVWVLDQFGRPRPKSGPAISSIGQTGSYKMSSSDGCLAQQSTRCSSIGSQRFILCSIKRPPATLLGVCLEPVSLRLGHEAIFLMLANAQGEAQFRSYACGLKGGSFRSGNSCVMRPLAGTRWRRL